MTVHSLAIPWPVLGQGMSFMTKMQTIGKLMFYHQYPLLSKPGPHHLFHLLEEPFRLPHHLQAWIPPKYSIKCFQTLNDSLLLI